MIYPFAGSHPITQKFWNKSNRYKSGYHNGVDWSMPKGTPLLAIFDGTVTLIERWSLVGYGRHVKIRSTDGRFVALYGHMLEIPDKFKVGDKVKAGQVLGLSGNTGMSIGPHLHLTLWVDGILRDALEYMQAMLPEKQPNEYTIIKGDTLSSISNRFFNDPTLWKAIYEANKSSIKNPNVLKVGQKIKIPLLINH